MKERLSKVDTKEFELPETVYSRDIESKVIQSIILQCLGKIHGVGLIEGNLFDILLGREIDRVKGIHVEQDNKNFLVNVKVEILVLYGVSIPKKAEEVQSRLVEEITRLTGLHVASVHVVVKGLIPLSPSEKMVQEIYPSLLLKGEEGEDLDEELTRFS